MRKTIFEPTSYLDVKDPTPWQAAWDAAPYEMEFTAERFTLLDENSFSSVCAPLVNEGGVEGSLELEDLFSDDGGSPLAQCRKYLEEAIVEKAEWILEDPHGAPFHVDSIEALGRALSVVNRALRDS